MQKDPGERGFVAPVGVHGGRVREGELAKVMRAEVLVGMLLAMGAGHKSTPKGGLNGLLEAALRGELTEEYVVDLRVGRFHKNDILTQSGAAPVPVVGAAGGRVAQPTDARIYNA